VRCRRSESAAVAAISLSGRHGSGIACEFVEADGYGLAEVHGAMLFAAWDTQQPVGSGLGLHSKDHASLTRREGRWGWSQGVCGLGGGCSSGGPGAAIDEADAVVPTTSVQSATDSATV